MFSSSVQLIDPDGRLVIVKIREGEEDLFLASVESDVLNAGFMTNYFQVSRGVCQGCPLSPLLFVLSVELLALKIRQDQLCRGIPLPDGQNAKISQFADDTTLILLKYTLFFYKNIVFPAQAEYSYFSADFRLKIFLYYS